MVFVFGFLSVCCLVYYGIIAVYSGIETSFSAIWLVLSFCLAVMCMVTWLYPRFREKISIRLEVSAITVVAALFVIFVAVEAAMGLNFFSLQKQSADYVIVLGAQVRGKSVSKTLEYRLDKAYEYAQVHPNTIFILSGGQGTGEDVSEAQAMYDYLRKRGVPDYQMMKEEQSRSTYENLVYSRNMINERETNRRTWIKNLMAQSGYMVPPDDEVTIRVGIITSNFHVLRAKGIAKKIGIQNISGIASKSDPVLFLHFCVRECFAILKDKFVGNM